MSRVTDIFKGHYHDKRESQMRKAIQATTQVPSNVRRKMLTHYLDVELALTLDYEKFIHISQLLPSHSMIAVKFSMELLIYLGPLAP